MRITITGPPGSGKSTVARKLSERLDLKRYSAGDIRRDIARQEGMTLKELNKKDEKTHEADRAADEMLKRIGEEEDDFVAEGRLPAYFIPDSIKIFLDVDPKVGAERVMKTRKGLENYSTVEEAQEKLAEREASDARRYRELYGIENYKDKSNFGLVIDTTNRKTEEVVEKILDFVKEKSLS